jgi:hypothetical protein
MECLRDHDTGSTKHLRRFLWSLWNGHHQVNLYNLGRVLDDDNGEAVAVIFTAWMRCAIGESDLREVLYKSGEMDRWDLADKLTPDGCPTDYPPTVENVREHCRKLDQFKLP